MHALLPCYSSTFDASLSAIARLMLSVGIGTSVFGSFKQLQELGMLPDRLFRYVSATYQGWQMLASFFGQGWQRRLSSRRFNCALEAFSHFSPLVLRLLRRNVVVSFSTGMSSEVGLILRLEWKPAAPRCLLFAADLKSLL